MVEQQALILLNEIKENIVIFNDRYYIKEHSSTGFENIEECVKAYIKERDKKTKTSTKIKANTIAINGRVLELSEYERLEKEDLDE